MAIFTINTNSVNFIELSGGYEVTKFDAACLTTPFVTIGYIPNGTTLATTNVIYRDFEGTVFSVSGWYSNGVISRYWDSSTTEFTSQMSC